jgi:phosphatidate cytidylyltransferase
MIRRILTSLILAPSALAVVFLAPRWLFLSVVSALAMVCFYEFAGIAQAHGVARPSKAVFLCGLMILWVPGPRREVELVAIFGIVLMATALRRPDLREALPSAGASLLGLMYCYGSWACAAALKGLSPHWLVMALSVNWIGDTVALIVGRQFGRTKMAPRISPGKTWEGAIASMLLSSILGMIYLQLALRVPLWQGLILTAAANFAGQMGDLAESGLKRGANLKDSSNLLPGHGGWLDRLDSSLFSMPAVYLLVSAPWASWVAPWRYWLQ